jgi:FkbM family methyltransferase
MAARIDFSSRKMEMSNECTIEGAETADVASDVHGARAEELLIRIAELSASPRPLTPYPGWRFDADWDNPDPLFKIRQQIWSYFRGRQVEAAVCTKWHYDLRLKLWLGNDLSKQMFIAGCDEPNEMAFVDGFLEPGMVFLDAGANEGLYTLLASARVGDSGRVYAFEPSSREFSRFSQNLSLNSISNVTALCAALLDKDGVQELNIAEAEHAGQNTLGGFAYEIVSAGRERVTTRKVDSLLREYRVARLDLMKIDVEGAELWLLKGAARALRKLRPVLLFEVSESSLRNMGSSAEELLAFIRSFRYDVYVFHAQTGKPALAKPGELTSNMMAAPIGVQIS